MKQVKLLLTVAVLIFVAACGKDSMFSNFDIIGDWVLKSGYSSGGFQMRPNDTTRVLRLHLKGDHSFRNETIMVMGGRTEGRYRIEKLNNERIMIIDGENTRPDTLQVLVVENKMTLSETDNGYTWNYVFERK